MTSKRDFSWLVYPLVLLVWLGSYWVVRVWPESWLAAPLPVGALHAFGYVLGAAYVLLVLGFVGYRLGFFEAVSDARARRSVVADSDGSVHEVDDSGVAESASSDDAVVVPLHGRGSGAEETDRAG